MSSGSHRLRRQGGTSPPPSPTWLGPTRWRSSPPPILTGGSSWCCRRWPTPRVSSTPMRSRSPRPTRRRCSNAGEMPGQNWPKTLRWYPDGQKKPWSGPPMSPTSMATARFMETWAHSFDVAEALGIQVEPNDRVRHVVHLGVRTRDFAFATHQLAPPPDEFRVELRAPSGTSGAGSDDAAQSVTGSAWDFALLVTHRRNREDLDLVTMGPNADWWPDVAQAFAGPPGEDAPRREAPHHERARWRSADRRELLGLLRRPASRPCVRCSTADRSMSSPATTWPS